MRILVVGGGAREHALVWKIAQSSLVKKIFCAPGNAGIAQLAECVPIHVTDIKALAAFATDSKIDLTVIGPEVPLVAGVVDVFEAMGLPVFGPSKEPAKLEGSKAFSKEIMRSAGIPTADFWTCHSREEAAKVLNDYYAHRDSRTDKIVIKADGIAAGKGVTVANNRQEADEALDLMMNDRIFGASGDSVVIEECLIGEEASIMAITDGATVLPLIPSQDHKRIYEGDLGANTGGMGAYTPVPVIPENTTVLALERIIKPAINAIRELGIPYRGILYAGVIVTANGPKCIEFNCRLGDPDGYALGIPAGAQHHGLRRRHPADRHREEERHHDDRLRHRTGERAGHAVQRRGGDCRGLPRALPADHDDQFRHARRRDSDRARARCRRRLAPPAWPRGGRRPPGVAAAHALYHSGHLPLYGSFHAPARPEAQPGRTTDRSRAGGEVRCGLQKAE